MPQDIIRDWHAHLAHERRRSEHTRRAYVATAERFCAFLMEHRGGAVDAAMLRSLSAGDLRAYLAARRAGGLGNASAARELSAIRTFLRFVGGSNASVPQMRGPRVRKGLPRPVAPDQALDLAHEVEDNARQGWTGARDFALLLLLYGAGLRIGEALSLTGAALPFGETLRVTGKRGKTRIVPILPAVAAAVARYVEACPWPIAKEAPLFLGARGGPLQPGVVRASVRSARRALGLPERTTPHALRHSFATHLLAGGADLRSLQELLGHASLASTQVYTAVDAAHLLDIYRNAHPRA
ncbi:MULTISPECIES: tyrosine recombinase XerC [Sphingopyxis]|uniref:tyrosine recombinase XerC n=1 Tax=Sphingopyxis TaxID=165697 RepID=UPI00086BCCE9|nr:MULTISPECIES: tyrosine recombinase XerC [Sphingopyxis]APW72420.1 recombinase XerC [Sphingopyxis granuli]AVA13261.1 tyrosine recombinase XerC [Sphingopyxis sp. MG]ODU30241.1 MAG: recombinase XerC [Sphingopyxis sp. SCN 67-31]QUM71732.1 tyrosine recombinase XerC [Sphingopyxis granuli]